MAGTNGRADRSRALSATRLMFTAPGRVELLPYDPGRPGRGEVLYRTLVSLISSGTEVAKYSGTQQVTYPSGDPYAAIGEVIEVGEGVTDVAPGDRIYTYGLHASVAKTSVLYVKVPGSLAPETAVFCRMASIAITAVRVSDVTLGDPVAVIGLGLVGNLCAQLFRLAGAEVIGLDLSARRRELARACGLAQVVEPGEDGGVAAVKELTGGEGARCTVEAVGVPRVALTACDMTAKLGEVIWLGSPRGEYEANVTDLLNRVHLWGHGCLTFKGAHEWRYPVQPAPGVRHSMWGNCHYLIGQIAAGRLVVDPLRTHVLSPHEAVDAYEGLKSRKDDYVGVVFDWSRL